MSKIDKYIFQSYWKTDDKEWLKQRRKGWKNIQIQLDRLRESHGDFLDMKKKDYKFYKNYFLTGRDVRERPLEELQYCLWEHAPSNRESYMLLQFWFCPEHSADTLEYIKSNTVHGNAYEKESKNDFEKACKIYRRTCENSYSGNYKWTEEEGTTAISGPIFGALESRMLALFAFSAESVKDFEGNVSTNKRILFSSFERSLLYFLGDFKPNHRVTTGYNPHNPIHLLIDEYVSWDFPRDHGELFHSFDATPKEFISAYALIMYVVDTPDGRPKKQLEFAKELKQRITDGLRYMPEETQIRWETAIQFYTECGLKTTGRVDYQ